MRVGKVKTQTRRKDYPVNEYGIASYGEANDYPEKIIEVVQASPTGSGCLSICQRFIAGEGFNDLNLAKGILNRRNQTGNILLKKVTEDYSKLNGFALHVNYNALFQITEVQHIPFEYCRIAIDKETKKPNGKIAIHPDWTSRKNLTGAKPKKDEVKYYPVFNPLPQVILDQSDGDIENYTGQVFYFSTFGELSYPLCQFDSVVTDMATEESVSTVLYRNAKHNYLPAGMIVKKGKTASTTDGGKEKEYNEDTGLASDVEKWQGDEQAAKIILVETDFDEDKPEFIPFQVQNFDKMFTTTSEHIQNNIGRIFMQPPILRGVDVGAGFGADLIENAYDVYNSITSVDRNTISNALGVVLKLFETPFLDTTIKKLAYAYDVNVNMKSSIIDVLKDSTLTPNQKQNILITLFKIPEQIALKLI